MSEVKNQVAAQLRADLMMMAHNRWNMGMDVWNNVSNNILRAADLLDALSHPAPDVPGADEVAEPKWLLVKRDLYYRPNSHGYTGVKDDAGRFDEDYARNHCQDTDVTMIREDEAPEYTKACWPDVIAEHAVKKFARLQAELDAARGELAEERTQSQMLGEALNEAAAELDAALALLREDQDGWMPIETAPREPTDEPFLVYRLKAALRHPGGRQRPWLVSSVVDSPNQGVMAYLEDCQPVFHLTHWRRISLPTPLKEPSDD